ncbi:integrase core domain-containing protein [Thermohalobaculum sediminis]
MAFARQGINDGKIDYNDQRPHSAVENLTPSGYAAQREPARKVA